jgi:hypothetical protein
LYFHSDLHLMPDARLGLYMSFNSLGKGESNPRAALGHKFLDRYFPFEATTRTGAAPSGEGARAVAGYYVASRRVETGFLAFMNALQQAQVSVNPDGTISSPLARGLNGAPMKFREVAPMVFEDVDGQDRLAFTKIGDGPLTVALPFPAIVLHRTSGVRHGLFNTLVVGFSLVVILLTLVLWPLGGLTRWHFGRRLEIAPGDRTLRRLTRVACLFVVATLAMIAYLASQAGTPGAFSSHLDPTLRVLQLSALLGALGSIPAIVHAYRTVRTNAWWWTKVHECVLATAFVAFAWFVTYWHVLTPSLHY